MKFSHFLILLFLPAILFSQTPSEKLSVDLQQSIEIALENNNDLRQKRFDKDKADELVSEAYGTSLFPSITGSVDYLRGIDLAEIFIDFPGFSGSFEQGTKNTMTAGIQLEQPLFTGAMFLAVDIAKTFAEISEKNVEYSKSDLITKVKETYYNVLLAEELVDLVELNLKLTKQNLSNTESMYKAGLVPEYDLLKAKVQHQNVIPIITETKSQVLLAKNNLKILMGLDLITEVDLLDSLKFKELSAPDNEAGFSQLERNNQLIKQLELDVKLKDLTASYQFTEHFPKLKLTGNWQYQAFDNSSNLKFYNWDYSRSIYVVLNLSVPIFKVFSIDSKVEQAEIDLKRSEEELIKVKRGLQNQLQNNLLLNQKSKEQVSAYELAVSESKRGYDISVKRFNTGLATQLEVTSALVDFTQAKINYLTSVRDYFISNARLDHILGNYSFSGN